MIFEGAKLSFFLLFTIHFVLFEDIFS